MKNNGFTLVELIIVMGVLSILAVGGLVTLNPLAQFQKANDSKRKSDLSQIQKALETYYQDNGKYPSVASQCSYTISGTNGDTNDCVEWGKSWQPYMNVIPQDPITSHHYVYFVSSIRQAYYLYASLERGNKDPQACAGGQCASPPESGIDMSKDCGGVCNFGVSSPNVSP